MSLLVTIYRFDPASGFQAYLIFQPTQRYFKLISNTNHIAEWKSKGLFDESIKPTTTSDISLAPLISYCGYRIRLKFNGRILRQLKVTFNHGKVENIYIVYEISKSINISDYPTLENCLFGAVNLTKNADINRHGYSGYGTGFDRHGSFSFLGTGLGRNLIIFGVDMRSLTKIDNREKDNLIFSKGPTQGLEHTLNAEKIYLINFIEYYKTFCLSLHYDGANSYLFVNGKEIHKFEAKDSEIVATPLCLGNFSKD